MHRSRGIIAAASMFALFGVASAHGQNSNRLMFDPNGLHSSDGRTGTFQSSTTGQSSTSQRPAAAPAAQTLTPPAKPTAATAPKPEARTTAGAPARSAPARRSPAQADSTRTSGETRTATERPIPREQPSLGRLSLPSGSVGYESQTQMKAYDMSDGRRVPGYDNIQRNDSSYFGLSLRVPTINQPGSSYRNHGFD